LNSRNGMSGLKILKVSSCVLSTMTFVSFCAIVVLGSISSIRQGYWKGLLGEELGQIDVLAKKRMWVNIWETWHPILWNSTTVLLGISVICIIVYFVVKRISQKPQK
jgi:hypothetical protein